LAKREDEMAEAKGRRFRRNYFAIFAALLAVWLFKNYTEPVSATSLAEFIDRASIGSLRGEWVLGSVILFALGMTAFGLATLNLQQATGEVLSKHSVFERLRIRGRTQDQAEPVAGKPDGVWQRPSAPREEYMTMIISDKAQAVAETVMQDLHRGITALHGEGMYTQKPREVLICALTETEIDALKKAVRSVDPQGFIVVMPASEIAGGGFEPLGT
jgi:hypothetical protein